MKNEIAWNVRIDLSVEPVGIVMAVGWYEGRELASKKFNVDKKRIHVEQKKT
jgi:hypothetical protein